MKNLSIVLIALHSFNNFSVRILHALLEREGSRTAHTIFFKDCLSGDYRFPTAHEEKLFISLLQQIEPQLVGFTVLTPHVPLARHLTKKIKALRPAPLILWGGMHPTITPESCFPEADIVCLGEGEKALEELAEALQSNRDVTGIKNLWIKQDGSILKNSLRPVIKSLEAIPFPAYGHSRFYFIESNQMTQNDPLLNNRLLFIKTSRGCNHACSYCFNGVLKSRYQDGDYYPTRRSVDNVIKEIQSNVGFQKGFVKQLVFLDENFPNDKDWLNDFANRYQTDIRLPFLIQGYPGVFDLESINKLKSAGVNKIYIGIQSGNAGIRQKVFHRTDDNFAIIRQSNDIVRKGIDCGYYFILDNPYDTEATLKETLEFLFQLPEPLELKLFSLQFYPNYPIVRQALADQKLQPEQATAEELIKNSMRHFRYRPKLFPWNRRQQLQNMIWLLGQNRDRGLIRFAVFQEGWLAKILWQYLSLKSILLGSIFGKAGLLDRHPRLFSRWRRFVEL